jgi:hypothetical protein
MTADGASLIYRYHPGDDDLHMVQISGGPSTRLNQPIEEGFVLDAYASSDPSSVIYTGYSDQLNGADLYSVHLPVGTVTQLSPSLEVGQSVEDTQISAGGEYVVFTLDTNADGDAVATEIWRARVPK